MILGEQLFKSWFLGLGSANQPFKRLKNISDNKKEFILFIWNLSPSWLREVLHDLLVNALINFLQCQIELWKTE